MPSDDRAERAAEAVAEDRAAFRSAVAGAVDEVGALLESRRSPAGAGTGDPSLGPLAEGRIDSDRFASLFEEEESLDPDSLDALDRAHEVLADVHRAGEEAYRVEVEGGDDLRDAVRAALARLGRAFGAARVVDLVRSGRYREGDHAGYLEGFPHDMWNAEERRIAPPLVVRLRGRDLRPGGLAEFLDGSQKVVLLVEGDDAPPASLVRLITPGTLVLQAADPDVLSAVADQDGPAAAALFPSASDAVARFVHDPGAEGGPAGRLTASHLPDEAELRPVGSMTRGQQAEELRQLAALTLAGAARPPSDNGGRQEEEGGGDAEPADRLAGWLLRQSGLDDLEG